jgi:hypothetical protein
VLVDAYEIAVQNQWGYLPFFEEIQYVIKQGFDLDAIANTIVESVALVKKSMHSEIGLASCDTWFMMYNHDFIFYFIQYFLAGQEERGYDYENLV